MSKLDNFEYRQLINDYFQKQQKYKSISDKFDQIKKHFYVMMEDYFKANNIDDELLFDDEESVNSLIKVKRVQSVSIKFDADKVEKRLPKEISSKVIAKQYTIVDIESLISYLKKCKVDPKIFKSFVTVSKSVNVKELERLEEIGEISIEQLKGCYTMKTNDPYFRVSKGKGRGVDD